ncbi:MAG TPA: ABC transporter permease [Candidatus Acidoferrales bacterium]|nr:ABC transporter permease [Candidatus Acidoferrales bacterium]
MSRESLTQFWLRIKALFLRRRLDRDLEEELQFHLAMREQKNGSDGAPPEEARAAARRRFGNLALLKEVCREMWTFAPLETFWQDVCYNTRSLLKHPGFTAVAVLTLALGISVNTTIFTCVNTMLIRKPPVMDPGRLMMVSTVDPTLTYDPDQGNVSAPDYLDWRAQSTSFSGMAAASFDTVTISGGSNPDQVPSGRVASNYFNVLGVAPALGRAFLPQEDQAGLDHVVILSDALWHSRFGADSRILGRTLKVNGSEFTIVGVMPPSFRFPNFPAKVWIPLVFNRDELSDSGRGNRWLNIFARLNPSVPIPQARSEMQAIALRLAQSHPETNKGRSASVKTLQQYCIEDNGANAALAFLMAAVAFVLLIACANLVNLLLARNTARRREFSIRSVIGAGRLRLIRQLLTESLMLSILGGGLGIALAFGFLRLILSQFNWNAETAAMAQEITMDTRVLAFTLALSVFAALLFGIAPALQISGGNSAGELNEGGRGTTVGREHHRLQRLLVITQLALSIFLLVGASLFVESFVEEMHAKEGLNPNNVLTATVSLRGLEYFKPDRQRQFAAGVFQGIANLPGVESAALGTDLPFNFPGDTHFLLEGHPISNSNDIPHCGYFAVTSNYFSTTQIPLLQGREFTPADSPDAPPVMIVNEAFAQKYFPRESPLGQHVRFGPDPNRTQKWSEIVGVAGNVDEFLGQMNPRPELYVPLAANPSPLIRLILRTRTDPVSFADPLRGAVWSVDGNQAVTEVRTMRRVISDSGGGDDLMSELMGSFAGLALLLGAIGIYGVLSYLVGQRTHELGIRMALGAHPREVLFLVIRNGMSLVVTGVAIGFVASLALPKLVAAGFQDMHFHSAWVLLLAPPVVLLVGLVACWVPARRAMRVDPMVALRYE